MESAEQQTYEPGDIVALQFDSPEQEAQYIVNTCKSLYGTLIEDNGNKRAISWSDMAVLIRVNASGEPIRAALRKAGIRVVSVGMNTLFDAPEAEASRKLFLFMNGEISKAEVVRAWLDADQTSEYQRR